MPILVAPTSMPCLAHPEGECATAQGAGSAGPLMIASTDATRSLEEIAQTASGPLWFQLYIYHSLEVGASMGRRGVGGGVRGVVWLGGVSVRGDRRRRKRREGRYTTPRHC